MAADSYLCALYRDAAALAGRGERVVSTDELTGVQAVGRLHPALPMAPDRVERREFEYIRHGTRAFILNRDVASGQVFAPSCGPRRTKADFVQHVRRTIATDPEAVRWHFAVGNLDIHKCEPVVRLVAELSGVEADLGVAGRSGVLSSRVTRVAFLREPGHKVVFPYTPVHASWLSGSSGKSPDTWDGRAVGRTEIFGSVVPEGTVRRPGPDPVFRGGSHDPRVDAVAARPRDRSRDSPRERRRARSQTARAGGLTGRDPTSRREPSTRSASRRRLAPIPPDAGRSTRPRAPSSGWRRRRCTSPSPASRDGSFAAEVAGASVLAHAVSWFWNVFRSASSMSLYVANQGGGGAWPGRPSHRS